MNILAQTTRIVPRCRTPLIIHVIDEFKLGGAQTHLVTMLREAVDAYPYIAHRAVGLFGDGPIAGELRTLGVKVELLDLRPYLKQRQFVAASGVLADLFRLHRPHLVEAHLTWSRLLGLYAAWRAGVPRRIGFEQGDIFMISWKFRLANFLGQHFAHRIIVCSHALKDWVHRTHGVSRKRIAVFHNCVDPSVFAPPNGKETIRAGFRLPRESTIFCAVGTLGRGVNKRVDVSIRAMARAREQGADVSLVVCGDGEQRPELEMLARHLGIADRVRFLGMRSDVPQVLAASDAFCHTAPFEPFGIVVLEAMATELPVLVPDSGGVREAVQDGVTGFKYLPLDREALAALMVRLAKNRDLRAQIGKNGRRAVEERFSVRRYARRLYEFYAILEPATIHNRP